MLPNQSLERTHQPVTKFAYASLSPVWRAAQLSCSVSEERRTE